ncbi:MAG: chloride channel protein [Alphaproteobacteria bacterium]|jgi:CIC family chloride channel protein|nr:chloride channel protein [Rhodospirillaceae bacterium]MDP6406329.1 chloride channel protein [Alphaproteobacteria bacterium]MDP6624642.1 chloride channel protein [Alphaproteobacteria bacterium]
MRASRRTLKRRFLVRWYRFWRNDQVVLSALAILAGAAAAYAAIGFRLALQGVQFLFYGFSSERVHTLASQLDWWHLLLAPAGGGLLIGLFLRYVMPGQRAQGVAQVIEAGALSGGRMSLNQGLAAVAVSVTSLGVGGSAGREGPMVHFGAVLASAIARRTHLSPSLALTLLGCGVAAGVAASFNAPIAGVFFALEVVIGHYALHAFSPIVIASVVGTLVSRLHLGDFPAFIVPEYSIVSFLEFPAFLLLGLLCAAIALIFMWSIMVASDVAERSKAPIWLRPAVGGLLVGAIAIFFPQVLGVGYEATDGALKAAFPLWLLVALIVAKTTATAITLGSGFGGGVFSPSLFIGAMAGGAFGMVAAAISPELASSPGLYAMVGMGAVAGPVLGAPISTILIVFELTGDYGVTVATMIAVSVASVVVHEVLGKSFFIWLLERRGLSIKGGRARQLLRSARARDLMSAEFVTLPEGATMASIRELFRNSPETGFFVIDEEGRLSGALSFADVKDVAFEAGLDDLINARDAARANPAFVEAGDNLERALALMDASGDDHLAVVDNIADRRVIGILHHRAVLREYNRALLKAHDEEHDNI